MILKLYFVMYLFVKCCVFCMFGCDKSGPRRARDKYIPGYWSSGRTSCAPGGGKILIPAFSSADVDTYVAYE